jgi:2-(1,2-epoxy-1,2-dihydrophenyl)acetyl-CoA isomerase
MEPVLLEREGPVGVVTLNRPGSFNAFDVPMVEALLARLREVAEDPAVRSVVLTGAGKAFCAGGDLQAMRAAGENPAPVFGALTRSLHPAVELITRMAKPVVAAVNGVAAGGGVGLALACDLRVASREAKFKAAYLTLGVVPDGGITWLLPRLVGPARAREFLLLDEPIDAERAQQLGMVNRVVPGGELRAEALAWAQRLAAMPRGPLANTKALLAQTHRASLDQQLRAERRWNLASAQGQDLQEGLRAFTEKRPPKFA